MSKISSWIVEYKCHGVPTSFVIRTGEMSNAHLIIEVGTTSSEIWQRFSQAKALAEEKRNAAYHDWRRIKRQMVD